MKDEGDSNLPSLRSFEKNDAENDRRFFDMMFHLHDVTIERCIPAIVTKIGIGDDGNKDGTVEVLPLAKYMKRTSEGIATFDRNKVEVPILRSAHGGFVIDYPVFVGDTGYLFSCDRNCKTAIENNSEILSQDDPNEGKNKRAAKPDDYSLFGFANGFFVPCSWSRKGIGGNDLISVTCVLGEETEDKPKISFGKKDGKFGLWFMLGDAEGDALEGKDGIEKKQVVADLLYDIELHQIQMKTRNEYWYGDVCVGKSEDSDWKMIKGGQAVPAKRS